MTMLQKAKDLTRGAWDEEWFIKPWEIAQAEVELAAKKGKSAVQLLHASKDIAMAVAARLKFEGFVVTIGTGKASGEKYSNFYVNVSWSEVE